MDLTWTINDGLFFSFFFMTNQGMDKECFTFFGSYPGLSWFFFQNVLFCFFSPLSIFVENSFCVSQSSCYFFCFYKVFKKSQQSCQFFTKCQIFFFNLLRSSCIFKIIWIVHLPILNFGSWFFQLIFSFGFHHPSKCNNSILINFKIALLKRCH